VGYHNGWGGQTKEMYRKGRVNIVYFKALTLHGIYLMQKKGRKLEKFGKKTAANGQELHISITKFVNLPSFATVFFFFVTTKEVLFL